MTKSPTVSRLSIEELLDRFALIGIKQREALNDSQIRTFNKLFREMAAIGKELRARGTDARLALLKLMTHPDIQVRLQAARFGYGADPKTARACIEEIANSNRFPQAGDAGMTITFLDDGISQLD